MILYLQRNKFEVIKDYVTVNTSKYVYTSLGLLLSLSHYKYLVIKLIGYESTLMKSDTIEPRSPVLVVCLYSYLRVARQHLTPEVVNRKYTPIDTI